MSTATYMHSGVTSTKPMIESLDQVGIMLLALCWHLRSLTEELFVYLCRSQKLSKEPILGLEAREECSLIQKVRMYCMKLIWSSFSDFILAVLYYVTIFIYFRLQQRGNDGSHHYRADAKHSFSPGGNIRLHPPTHSKPFYVRHSRRQRIYHTGRDKKFVMFIAY